MKVKMLDKLAGKKQFYEMKKELVEYRGHCTKNMKTFLNKYPEYQEEFLTYAFSFLKEKLYPVTDKIAFEYMRSFPKFSYLGEEVLIEAYNNRSDNTFTSPASIITCMDILTGEIRLNAGTREVLESYIMEDGSISFLLILAAKAGREKDVGRRTMFEERALEQYYLDKQRTDEHAKYAIEDDANKFLEYIKKYDTDVVFVEDVLADVFFENLTPETIFEIYHQFEGPLKKGLDKNKYFRYILENGNMDQIATVGRVFTKEMSVDMKETMIQRFMELSDNGGHSKRSSSMAPETYIRCQLYGIDHRPQKIKRKDGRMVYDEDDNRFSENNHDLFVESIRKQLEEKQKKALSGNNKFRSTLSKK